jgi:hypothetical protein
MTGFKLEAAQLIIQQGYSIVEASRSLSIDETALRRWVARLTQENAGLRIHLTFCPGLVDHYIMISQSEQTYDLFSW